MTDEQPALVLTARRTNDPFSQIVGTSHFENRIDPRDVNNAETLSILAAALKEAAHTAVDSLPATTDQKLLDSRTHLLTVMDMPAALMSAGTHAQFMRDTNPQDDQ